MTRRITFFVSLPSGEEFQDIYNLGIKTAEKGNVHIVCYKDRITDTRPFGVAIRRLISHSNLVIGVLAGDMRNIMYEIGTADALGKPLLLIADQKELPAMIHDREVQILRYDAAKPDWEDFSQRLQRCCTEILCDNVKDKRLISLIHKNVWGSDAPEPTPAVDCSMLNSDVDRGLHAYHHQDHDLALKYLEPLLDKGSQQQLPSDVYYAVADSHFAIAESLTGIHERQVHYIQQEKAIKAGLNYFPKDPSLLRQSGISSMKMGILPAAEQIFRNLVEEDSENFLARYNLACVHALRSKRLACINTLEELFRFGEVHREWRANARIDPDFDNLWENDLFQRVLYPLNLL